jgi:NADP-dependent 3-hydroxy acid dehydrogenase YdfG
LHDPAAAASSPKAWSSWKNGTWTERKVAPVTGANRGIGAAITAELAREGMHLCIVARDPAKLPDVAATLVRTPNIDIQLISANLRDPAAPAQAIAQAVRHFGRLDLRWTMRQQPNAQTSSRWQKNTGKMDSHWNFTVMWGWSAPSGRTCALSKPAIVNIVAIGSRAGSAEFTIGGSVNAALLNIAKAMADIGNNRVSGSTPSTQDWLQQTVSPEM